MEQQPSNSRRKRRIWGAFWILYLFHIVSLVLYESLKHKGYSYAPLFDFAVVTLIVFLVALALWGLLALKIE